MPIEEHLLSHGDSFLPHGTCIAWDVPLLSLYVISDIIIALAYFSVPIVFCYLAKKQRGIEFKPAYLLYAAVFITCGLTHALSVITLWYPMYYLAGVVKLLTAISSTAVVIYIIPKLSEIVKLPSLKNLLILNQSLRQENEHSAQVEQQLLDNQQVLADSNRLLQAVLDAFPVRLFWKDTSLNFLGANLLFAQDAKLESVDDLIGKSDYDMVWKDHAEFYQSDDMEVISTGKKKLQIEDRQPDDEGNERWIVTNKIPLLSSNGSIIGLLGSYEDITERKLMEQGLILAKETAEEADKAKSRFLSRMSHELRTPLNGILGFAQLLESEELTQEQQDDVEMIISSGQHLLNLINEVLELARVESGKVTVSIEPVCINDVFDDVFMTIETQLEQNNLNLALAIPKEQLWVKADRIRLKQLLFNLLSNAVKYNCPNGQINIEVRDTGETVFIGIEDTGQGIAQDDIEQIFEPFNRLSQEHSSIEGTGIGLTISKQIAQLMNADLQVKSQLGQGTIFWFELIKVQHEPSNDSDTEGNQLAKLTSGEQKRILYVEDNPVNMKLMKSILARVEGVTMLEAVNGADGLAMAEQYMPDVILLDIDLPDISGYEVLNTIKSLDVLSQAKIIAVSANAMNTDVERGIEAGFDAYLTKPIDFEQLLKLITTSQ